MKNQELIGISVFAGIVAIIILQLILPAFVSSFSPSLDALTVVDAVNIVNWAALFIIAGAFFIIIVLLSKQYRFNIMLLTLAMSLAIVLVLICAGSFVYLYIKHSEIFADSSVLLRMLKFLTYPTLVSLVLENPQPIWLLTIVSFIVIFDLSFIFLLEGKN